MEAAVKFDQPLSGRIYIVSEDRVGYLSQEGWRVIAFYQEACHVPFQDQKITEQNLYSPVSFTTYKPVTITKFVMWLDEESALAKAAEEARTHQQAAVIAKNELAQVKKELEESTNREATTQSEADRLKQWGETYKKDHEVQQASNRKLEADIAKIRKAMGELKLKEILGSP